MIEALIQNPTKTLFKRHDVTCVRRTEPNPRGWSALRELQCFSSFFSKNIILTFIMRPLTDEETKTMFEKLSK